MTVLTIVLLRQRAADARRRAAKARWSRDRDRWTREAGWDDSHADELESWETAVADMAAMDAGAGDMKGDSIW